MVKLEKKANNYFLLLYLIIFFCKIGLCLFSECNYTHPIKKNGECIIGGCTADEFSSGICTIENEIIKTQWITNRIRYSGFGACYAELATTPNGNLICISNYFQSSTKKEFYGLKQNGRPYFEENNVETPFHEIDTQKNKYEGNVFAIQLNGDDKEYIISFGNNNGYFEIYDFEDNDKSYIQEGKTFFGTGFTFFSLCLNI